MSNIERSVKLMVCPKCGRWSRGLPGQVCDHGAFASKLGYVEMEQVEYVPVATLRGAVSLTPEEIRGLRMALRFGVPDPEPDEIRSARVKLEAAEHAALGGRYDRITPPSPDTEDTEDTGKTRETP